MEDRIGKKLSHILVEIEETLLESYGTKPDFTDEGFRAAVFIFSSALMDKMYELQDKEDIPFESKKDMAMQCGVEIRELVKRFSDIDTHELYKVD